MGSSPVLLTSCTSKESDLVLFCLTKWQHMENSWEHVQWFLLCHTINFRFSRGDHLSGPSLCFLSLWNIVGWSKFQSNYFTYKYQAFQGLLSKCWCETAHRESGCRKGNICSGILQFEWDLWICHSMWDGAEWCKKSFKPVFLKNNKKFVGLHVQLLVLNHFEQMIENLIQNSSWITSNFISKFWSFSSRGTQTDPLQTWKPFEVWDFCLKP